MEVWVDILLLHELFDLFTPLNKLSYFFGQNSHFQTGIRNLRNLLNLIDLFIGEKSFCS